MKAIKKPVVINFEFAEEDGEVEALGGIVKYRKGDAVITGVRGEKYPCRRDIFDQTYSIVGEDGKDEREIVHTDPIFKHKHLSILDLIKEISLLIPLLILSFVLFVLFAFLLRGFVIWILFIVTILTIYQFIFLPLVRMNKKR